MQGEAACPWDSNGEIPDDTPRCEVAPEAGQRVRYLCLGKPDDIDTCEACDLTCIQQIVTSIELSPNECVTYPEEIVCGPNPDTEECCYIVYAGDDRCME